MTPIDKLEILFIQHADPDQAERMTAYLLGKFPHYGIQTPLRRKLTSEFLREEAKKERIEWDLADQLWQRPEREFHQTACDLLIKMKKYLSAKDLVKIKALAQKQTWWDTVDALTSSFRYLTPIDSEVKKVMRNWAKDPDFWVRRMAICSQILAKEKTDQTLLAEILSQNFGSDEFFINKAIGWALRDYSKSNPDWVRDFLKAHKSEMVSFSVREASKYI